MWNMNALTLSIAVIVLVIANVWVFPNLIELPPAAESAPQSESAESAESAKPAPSMKDAGILQGILLKIEGEFYVVKDADGKEVRLNVGKNTALDAQIKVGDKIVVQIAADGHAATVLKAPQ